MSARSEEPVTGTCSKCRANTAFEMDPYEKEPMSVCCWRPMLNLEDLPEDRDQ